MTGEPPVEDGGFQVIANEVWAATTPVITGCEGATTAGVDVGVGDGDGDGDGDGKPRNKNRPPSLNVPEVFRIVA